MFGVLNLIFEVMAFGLEIECLELQHSEFKCLDLLKGNCWQIVVARNIVVVHMISRPGDDG